MKDHKITMLMILFFFIGLLVFFYPTLSNYYNEKSQSRTIYNYENILKNTNQIDFGKVKNDAIEYNKKLSKLKEPLLTYDTLKNYKKLLNINNDGMMGYLTIDKIKVELPIYHTVSETVLNSSVGHLEGTSLPIGGKGTHSVLSAHRGLPSAKLFTELDKLEIGDTFKITILDETHVYKVDKISIVKPNDRNELKINKDNDYITLLTCTPYGINTHRLLVRGERIKGDIKKDYITTEGFKVNRLIVMPIIALPIIALLLIVLLIKPVKRVNINKYEKYLYPNGKDFHGGKI
ncbi:lPXTG-site transpeptidase (Sortase) family protein [Clostridium sp. CAG:524]|nr:lPXTG-site transpeptidase (Sortase) family protein [Clostridium sp. CAG:524]